MIAVPQEKAQGSYGWAELRGVEKSGLIKPTAFRKGLGDHRTLKPLAYEQGSVFQKGASEAEVS